MGGELKRQVVEGREKSVWMSDGNGSLEFRNLANGLAAKNLRGVRMGFPKQLPASAINPLFLRLLSITRHPRSYIGDLRLYSQVEKALVQHKGL
jgi:hypothetical protein